IPPASFDLVNQRLGFSWLRTWDWKKLLLEHQRVCRPGGIIRISEPTLAVESQSPALTTLLESILTAFHHSGRLFTERSDGVISELVPLMEQHGIQEVSSQVHTLIWRAGTPEGDSFYHDILHLFRTVLPFLEKWTRVPDDYRTLHQQAITE